MKEPIRIDIIEKLFQNKSSWDIVRFTLKRLIPKKRELKSFIVMILFCLLPAYLIGFSSDTVQLFLESVQIINDVILSLFGVTFTGYALFQALMGKEMTRKMLSSTTENEYDEKSKLQESNEIFVEVMMLQLICIVINCFGLVVGKCIPKDYVMFEKVFYNNILTFLGLEIYFYISAMAIIAMKSFLYNIFQLFNLYAGCKAVEILKEEK